MPSPVQFQETYSMDHLRQTGTARASDYSSENCVVVKELGVADAKVPKEFTAQGTTPSGKPRVFVCGMCTRAFARLEHLRRHERSHTKEKPFDCGVCQRKFSRRDLLLRHAQKLHAGCDDAVARMRRKSSKARTTSSASYDTDLASSSAPASKASSMTRSDALKRSPYHNSSAESQDSVNFNLNSFTGSPGQTQDSLKCTTASASKISRSNSVKDSSLKKQLFDKRKPRFRRASFSAQSGPNYAMVPPQQYDSSTAENVEFSTPQILPTFGSDDDTWLSNLCTIPGMSAYKTQPEINEQTQTYNFDHEFPKHTAMFGGGMHQDLMSSEGMLSTESSHINTPNSHTPHMSHRPSLILNSSSLQADSMYQVKSDLDRSGYSFYDIPDTYIKSTLPTSGVIRPLSPIRQEYEDELMDLDTSEQFLMKTMPGPSHMPTNLDFSHNQMHDLEEFNKCFETGGKSFMSGYSFYGDNPSIPSTGIESMSSHAPTSPSNLQPSHVQPYQNSFLKDLSSHPENHVPLEAQLENTSIFEYGYSRSILFTSNLRQLIKKSLKKYPISDITSPTIPSNENMEFYKRTFVEKFLTYFPFLHASKLNEYEIMDMTSEEDLQNESARVCLPLLVATLGALLANNKSDSDQLYEASRRTVHIYLESRKKGDKQYPTNHQQQNSLWLIQSLTLSVIYGLFSDSENNIQIVIRQLNALNSLVKTSIKSNSEIIFTVSGQDQMIIEFAKESRWSAACKALRYTNDEEVKFKYAIIMQSQERSVLTIYQLTNFILMMFNVPLTLGVTELGSLKCPNIHDEFLWGFNDYNEFTTFGLGMEYQKSIDSLLFKDEANTIVFRDILRNLCSNKGEGHVTSKLKNLSRFGYNCVVRGLFELSQYEEYKYLNMVNVLQNVIKSGDSSLNNPHTRFMTTDRNLSQIVDYSLLVNFVKVCSIIDFRMVKEQSWLRNYDILTNNFHMFLTSMDSITDSEYLKVIDYCISITKVVMFRVSDLHNLPGINHRDTNNTSASKVLGGFDVPVTDFERVFGLQVEDEISCNTSPLYSQILFHIFVIFSIFAVSIAKRNSIRTNAADFHTGKEWQLNHKFISVLSCLSRFEDHMRVLFENHQLGVEMTNLFLLSSGNSREILLDNQGLGENQYDQTEIFAYSLDKALYILRVGEMMLRFLYEQNIKVIILKNLGGSISQIRKYLIDEESKILS